MLKWFYNKVELAVYKSLPERTIKRMSFINEIKGIKVFKSPDLPDGGILELFNNHERIVIIHGTKSRVATHLSD